MTPKEKAKELMQKMDVIYYMKLGGKNSNSKGLPISMYDSQVKQCALIAVDEIIECTPSVDMYPPNFQRIHSRVREYWQEVKQEIKKL